MLAIEEVSHYCGESSRKPLIERIPVDALVSNLAEEGFVVDKGNSEKEVQYSIRKGNGEIANIRARVPLETQFPNYSKPNILEYVLRVKNGLELKIEDYADVRCSSPGGVGGDSYGDEGIQAELTLRSCEPDTSAIGRIKNALQRTYSLEAR